MLTYLSSRGCPKCGGKNTLDTYYPEHSPLGRPEVIRRRCYRCAYCWNEAPLDAAGAAVGTAAPPP